MKRILAILTVIAFFLTGWFMARSTAHSVNKSTRAVVDIPAKVNAVSMKAPDVIASKNVHAPATRTSAVNTTFVPARVIAPATAPVRGFAALDPETQSVSPFADLGVIPFERMDSYMKDGRRVWVGRNAEEGATYVTAASEHEAIGVLSIPGADTYEIRQTASGQVVTQIAQVNETCATEFDHIAPTASAPVENTMQNAADIYTVDIAVFYDDAAATEAGGAESFQTTMLARVESMNQVLLQSNVTNFRWNLLGTYRAEAYATNNDLYNDLNQLVRTSTAINKAVMAKATEVGADQMMLIVGGTRNYAGVANSFPGKFSVVVYNQASHLVIAHELAHNFGCNHDRATENATDNNGRYSYGQNLAITEFVGSVSYVQQYGTIMSYNGIRIGYFSNPDVSYKGYATGVAVDQPKAAYNAKVLIDTAAAMSGARGPANAPVITSHPGHVTANVGTRFTISVTATGTNLTYQWFKGGAAIANETSSSLVRTAAKEDTGTYYVTVSNSSGTVTSNPATVTINDATVNNPAPAPSTPITSSGGGGGGGGGAPSHWFMLALLMAATARYFQNRNQKEDV